jgi:hypothetical protein
MHDCRSATPQLLPRFKCSQANQLAFARQTTVPSAPTPHFLSRFSAANVPRFQVPTSALDNSTLVCWPILLSGEEYACGLLMFCSRFLWITTLQSFSSHPICRDLPSHQVQHTIETKVTLHPYQVLTFIPSISLPSAQWSLRSSISTLLRIVLSTPA